MDVQARRAVERRVGVDGRDGVGAGCWTAATGAGGTLGVFCSPLPAGDPVRESPASGYSAFARLLYRSGMSYSLLV